MIFWLDAHLSPHLAEWMSHEFNIEVHAVRDIGLTNATDRDIFIAARKAGAVLISKDSDFLALLERHGSPPQLIWLTCGNTSNAELRKILQSRLNTALAWLKAGEQLVEISDRPG